MDLRRVRPWDWLAGAAGAVLIGSMFLHWYGANASGNGNSLGGAAHAANAWQAFAVDDVFLLLAGLLGVAIVIASATQRSGAVPQSLTTLAVIPAIVAAILVVIRTIALPSLESVAGGSLVTGALTVTREAGLWVGLVAALTLLIAVCLSMSDQRLPGFSVRDLEITPLPPPTPEGERR